MAEQTTGIRSSFFIGESLRQGWDIFKKKWLFLLGIWIFMMVVSAVPTWIRESMGKSAPAVIMGVVWVVSYVLQMVVGMGATRIFIQLARKEKTGIEELWSHWDRVIPYFLGTLLMAVITFGGLLLLIIPGFVWGITYGYIPYLIIDKGVGPREAMKLSKKMTDHLKWDLLGFHLVTGVLLFLGVLALFVGVFVAAPVVAIAQAYVYNKLVQRIEK